MKIIIDISDELYNYIKSIPYHTLLEERVVSGIPLEQEKVGHWEDSSNGWMCSECKTDHMIDTKYCPNCGARMEGET